MFITNIADKGKKMKRLAFLLLIPTLLLFLNCGSSEEKVKPEEETTVSDEGKEVEKGEKETYQKKRPPKYDVKFRKPKKDDKPKSESQKLNKNYHQNPLYDYRTNDTNLETIDDYGSARIETIPKDEIRRYINRWLSSVNNIYKIDEISNSDFPKTLLFSKDTILRFNRIENADLKTILITYYIYIRIMQQSTEEYFTKQIIHKFDDLNTHQIENALIKSVNKFLVLNKELKITLNSNAKLYKSVKYFYRAFKVAFEKNNSKNFFMRAKSTNDFRSLLVALSENISLVFGN